MENKTAPPAPNEPDAIHIVKLLQRRKLTDNAFEIELTRPPSSEYKAGQTIRFIYESMERYYSLISTPDDPTLTLCLYHVPGGRFSPVLADAELGTRFSITGPHGYFTFTPSERPPVFVATGAGVAPFVSMGRCGVTGFTILHEVESARDLYYQDLFRRIASRYIPCLLQPSRADREVPDMFHGNAAGYVKENLPSANDLLAPLA